MQASRASSIAAIGLLVAVAGYCLAFERSLYAAGWSLLILALLVLVLGRLLTSSLALAAIVLSVVTVSIVKNHILQIALHSSDILMISNWDMQKYLWSDQRHYMVALYASAALIIAMLAAVYMRDTSYIPRITGFAILAIGSLFFFTAASAHSEHPEFNFTSVNRHLTNFYASLRETTGIAQNRSYFGISNNVKAAGINQERCNRTEDTPNIIMIHEESLFPPSLYSEIEYDRSIDPFFKSVDGDLHLLRVETFGSGSWLTEFSVFSGLSTEAFGGVRSMAPAIMTGKLGDSLTQWLKSCGYTNIELSPFPEGFAFSGRFLRSIGFDRIIDRKAQKASTFNERDAFYFNNAIAEMKKHFADSSQPLFTYIMTMATHYPYDYTYAPEENVAGGTAKSAPYIDEYLRRVGLAVRDYRAFVSTLKASFPSKKFLILHYGDHQPIVTGNLAASSSTSSDPRSSIGYLTYFAFDTINYTAPPLPKQKIVDIPYLGSIALMMAKLPLNEATASRLSLLEECDGRYSFCPKKKLIADFQERLFETGALKVH
ncbi:hypothetical protein DLM45_15370 [Hyphomicrobium methylovorum]|nr:hypothetical protein [Hyphomicrobium methylovorum]